MHFTPSARSRRLQFAREALNAEELLCLRFSLAVGVLRGTLLLSHTMKTLAASSLSLLVGASLGWYIGYTRPIAEGNRLAKAELQSMNKDIGMGASVAMGAIPLIDRGDYDTAVKRLARPI